MPRHLHEPTAPGRARDRMGGVARRATLVAVHGVVAAYAAREIGALAGGIVEAGALLLAATIALVTAGLTIAAAVDGSENRLSSTAVAGRACSCCGGPMTRFGELCVCPACDCLPAMIGPLGAVEGTRDPTG